MAKPKLALIPAAQGDKFYSVLPSDGVGDFDFTRNSSATRIAPTGFIEEVGAFGSELVTNGNFDDNSNWTLTTPWNIANGKANYDDTSTSFMSQSGINLTAGKNYKITFTISNASSGAAMSIYDSSSADLLLQNENWVDGTYERFFIPSNNEVGISVWGNTAGNSYSIDNISIVEVIGNKSRLNYDLLNGKVVNCPHYLLEPASTNLITYSEDFSNASWTKSGVSISTDVITSPDGSLNADKIVEDTSTGSHRVYKGGFTSVANKTFTLSAFVKSDERNWFNLSVFKANDSVAVGGDAWFDVYNGIIGTTNFGTSKIENYGNGWYRCSFTFLCNANATALTVYNLLAEANGDSSYTGDGVSGLYIFGAMLEESSYPTSYIPTNGTAITRAAESATGSGDAATFNDSEGVLMVEASALANDGTSKRVSISDGTYSNRIVFDFSSTTNTINGFVISQGANVYSPSEVVNEITQPNKFAIKYKQNDFSFFINGFKFDVDNSGDTPINLSQMQFSEGDGSASPFYGKTREVQYFDSALTDAQLETLTSWTSLQEMITSQLYTNY